jgi:hypothetical protein
MFTNMDYAGILPMFFSETDPRPAKEQIAEQYISGWRHFDYFSHVSDHDVIGQAQLHAKPGTDDEPGDPPMREVSRAELRDETLILFECEWLAIVQKDGSFEVQRCD